MKDGWEIKALGDVCHLQNGFAFKSKLFKTSGTPVLRISSIQGDRINDNRPTFVNPSDYKENLDKYKVIDGDLLIAMSGGTTGKVGFNQTGLTYLLNQRVGKFEPSQKLDARFLYYYLSTKVQENLDISAGSAQPNLSTKQIKEFPIPLPPLEEQKLIVDVLDTAFEGLTRAQENVEANLESARELFEKILNSELLNKGKVKSVTLDEVASITSSLVDPRLAEFLDQLHLGAGNMETGRDVLNNLKTSREEGLKSGKYTFDDTMVLYSKIRPYLRKVARPDFKGLCSADIYPLVPNSEHLNKSFLFHLLMSKNFTDYAISGSERAGMPKVNQTHLFKYRFGLPSLSDQVEIVKTIDDTLGMSEALQANYRAKLQDLDDLRQSLLQKAFAGELT